MEASVIQETTGRVRDAVDALVGESIDGFSTDALGADVIDIRREIDRLEAEFLRRCTALIAATERGLREWARCRGCAPAVP